MALLLNVKRIEFIEYPPEISLQADSDYDYNHDRCNLASHW